MPFRFRKSFKILPGIKINLSKSGISTSIGGKGASVNVGKRGVRSTIGVPGTGISFSRLASVPKTKRQGARQSVAIQTLDQPDAPDDYQPAPISQNSTKKPRVKIPFGCIIPIAIIAICWQIFFCSVIIGSIIAPTTPTTPSTVTPLPIPTLPRTIEPRTIEPTSNPAEKYLEQYGGSPEAYARIFSLTDCKVLQEEFEIAYANNQRETPGTKEFKWTTGYMTAIDDHMREIGCY